MKIFRALFAAGAALLALAACTQAQIQTAASAAQALVSDACTGAKAAQTQAQAAVKGGAANTVASLSSYIAPVCASATTIAAFAADPSTAAWLGDIQGQFKALTSIATGATPVPVVAPAAPATSS